MLRLPYGVDPDETWEIDLTRSVMERGIALGEKVAANLREKASREKDPKEREALEGAAKASDETVARMKAALAAYDGAGPVFLVGPIPNGKRGALLGEGVDLQKLDSEKERGELGDRWAAEVVRWSVKGHRNLKRRDGATEIPFVSEPLKWNGSDRQVVSAKTLEAYGPLLRDLAEAVLDSQRIDEAGKNG